MDRRYFTIDDFLPEDGPIFHGFFGRQGGVSDGLYESLNCGAGSNDAADKVSRNRALVAEQAGCAPEHLLSLYQVHSDRCIVVRSPDDVQPKPEADALVTDVPGLALGVLTADCGPVLFYGEKEGGASVVGAAHAGWGGALGGVLESTVNQMLELGAEQASLRAAIGPCISKASYEVSEDFALPFLKEDDENERFFMAGQKEGHLMFDLSGYCALKLAKLGLKHVFIKDMDTYSNEDQFFSYRRTTHRKEEDYGRQVSVISIKA